MNYVLKAVLLTFAAMLLFSCSRGNDKVSNIDPRTGKHPAGWAVADTGGAHPEAYLAGPSACYECHGKDLSGGISKVSCSSASRSGITCHAGGPSGHPSGWAAPEVHGAAVKALSAGRNGLAHCQVCHGADFSGGIARTSCLNTAGCHGTGIMAAHSPRPWLSRIGGRTHSSTDPSNAAACAVCHTNGANSSRIPAPAAPAGTTPDCFNNTLCHGVEGHAFAGWTSARFHGAAAKAAEGGITINGQFSPTSSFGNCAQCHGTKFDGGTAQQTCLKTAGCHGADAASPHPASPWRSTTGGVTHTTTDTSNAGQCAGCHTNGANSSRSPRTGDPTGSSGCFNNTLCHGAEGHLTGWNAAAQHGAAAKSVPGAATGFSSCQLCHGSTFNNGSAPSCMNTLGCHGLLVSSPHPEKPWTSAATGASTHTTTDSANAATCAICHTAGANSRVVPPNPASGTAGCYNNTLCHFHTIPFAPPTVDPSVHGGLAKQNQTVCQNCHGVKGTTSFDGLALGGGVTTVACSSCHTFAKAHPTAWQGSTTNPGETVIYSHRTAGSIANACTLCHDVTQGRTAPLPAAPSCFSTTFTNGLNQTGTCHASGPGVAPHNHPKYPNHNATARGNFDYCLGCHKVDEDVTTPSIVIPRCLTCHLTSPAATLTGCTSCHAKPPNAGSYPNIAGSHSRHSVLNVTENSTQTAVCDQCHSGLGFGTVDHLDRARQKALAPLANAVVFGTLANSQSTIASSCATSWCHGGNTTLIPQNNPARTAPDWGTPFPSASVFGTGGTAGTSGSGFCAQCHGYPPLTVSHSGVTASQCNGCHVHLDTDGLTFNNSTKHINGSIDALAHGFPYPGATHMSAGGSFATNCAGCHDTVTASLPVGTGYPVAAGTPPKCAGCHLTWSNSDCSDCHGNATGRPNGASFPNRAGEHSNDNHVNRSCTVCHPFTSGDTRHGWSNRQKSTFAAINTTIGWNATNKTCSNSCHGTESWY